MNEDVIEVMEEAEDPFLTVSEISEEIDVTRSAVYKRLSSMEEDGLIKKKEVGAQAVVWWLPDRYESDGGESTTSFPSSVSQ